MATLTNTEKKFLSLEGILIVGAIIYLFISSTPNAINPISGQVVSQPNFVFEIENSNTILISTDRDFANHFEIKEGEEITLPAGTYFWKVKGFLRNSEIQTFTIEGNVGLNLRQGDETDLLENSGNVDVKVSQGGITSGIVKVGGSEKVNKTNETYEGEQNE